MKNKYFGLLILGAIISLVGISFIILAVMYVRKVESSVTVNMTFYGVIILAFGVIWFKISLSKSRKFCNKCGGKMFGCEYSYQEVEVKRYPNSSVIDHIVEIIAICPYCGTEKFFRKKFTAKRTENIEYLINRFCRDKFGH